MSGPKVINIEAIRLAQERIGKQQLREIRLLVSKIVDGYGDGNHVQSTLNNTLSAVAQMEEKSNWTELATRGPGILLFLKAELEALDLEKQAAFDASIRRRQNLLNVISSIDVELKVCGLAMPPILKELRSGLTDEDLNRAEQEVKVVLNQLADTKEQRYQAKHKVKLEQLAAEFLDKSEQLESVGSWMGTSAPKEEKRFFEGLSALYAWLDPDRIQTYQNRFSEALQETDFERRQLLIDSINLEISDQCKVKKEALNARALLEQALILLAPFSGERVLTMENRIHASIKVAELGGAKALLEEVRSFVEKASKQADAAARRDCVLKALGGLGYEIHDGMQIVWEQKGKLTVSKPGESNYGVEFLMPTSAHAVQARVVAFRNPVESTETSRQRDKEVEQTWCSDLIKLRELMSLDGFNSSIVQAYAPGEQPVKAIGAVQGDRSSDLSKQPEKTQQRTL